MQKNYNLSIGVMFKNEAHIMDEWVKHYLRIGADHIYMINHLSNIIDILNNSEYNAFSVPWINFGSNGLLDTPKSAVKSFTKRADYNSLKHIFVALRQFKTVFNTDTFNKVVELHSVGKFSRRHEVVHQIQMFSESHIEQMDLAINHYSIQAKKWYNKIKNKKLAGNSALVKYNSDYWSKMNTNQIEDYVLEQQYE